MEEDGVEECNNVNSTLRLHHELKKFIRDAVGSTRFTLFTSEQYVTDLLLSDEGRGSEGRDAAGV